ncbi:hypothetical protein QBC34DRAFT_420384 [Podospora aff. communis PSN243]|uniref:Uncharacterized protein n=1 Tax=Podospora aff. communis PSN243 TaxID=3040156 RepID=A0AAV9H3H5_9PEZI|nr:hypothetical protein QBC34DRAFT_420384 [Podospora aff. communis PSN243]
MQGNTMKGDSELKSWRKNKKDVTQIAAAIEINENWEDALDDFKFPKLGHLRAMAILNARLRYPNGAAWKLFVRAGLAPAILMANGKRVYCRFYAFWLPEIDPEGMPKQLMNVVLDAIQVAKQLACLKAGKDTNADNIGHITTKQWRDIFQDRPVGDQYTTLLTELDNSLTKVDKEFAAHAAAMQAEFDNIRLPTYDDEKCAAEMVVGAGSLTSSGTSSSPEVEEKERGLKAVEEQVFKPTRTVEVKIAKDTDAQNPKYSPKLAEVHHVNDNDESGDERTYWEQDDSPQERRPQIVSRTIAARIIIHKAFYDITEPLIKFRNVYIPQMTASGLHNTLRPLEMQGWTVPNMYRTRSWSDFVDPVRRQVLGGEEFLAMINVDTERTVH